MEREKGLADRIARALTDRAPQPAHGSGRVSESLRNTWPIVLVRDIRVLGAIGPPLLHPRLICDLLLIIRPPRLPPHPIGAPSIQLSARGGTAPLWGGFSDRWKELESFRKETISLSLSFQPLTTSVRARNDQLLLIPAGKGDPRGFREPLHFGDSLFERSTSEPSLTILG